MKGISAVIAVVLILMITVALAAMAYVWFTGVFETITTGAGEAAERTGQTIATSFDVVSAGVDSSKILLVYITNTGSSDIWANRTNIFVGVTGQDTSGETKILRPGETYEFSFSNHGDSCNKQLKVTYGSLERYTQIQCETFTEEEPECTLDEDCVMEGYTGVCTEGECIFTEI